MRKKDDIRTGWDNYKKPDGLYEIKVLEYFKYENKDDDFMSITLCTLIDNKDMAERMFVYYSHLFRKTSIKTRNVFVIILKSKGRRILKRTAVKGELTPIEWWDMKESVNDEIGAYRYDKD